MEREGIGLSGFYPGEGVLPCRCHFNIGNLLVLYRIVNRQPFFGRHQIFLIPAYIATGKQCLDDGCTGSRSADTDLPDSGTQLFIADLFAAMLHSGK